MWPGVFASSGLQLSALLTTVGLEKVTVYFSAFKNTFSEFFLGVYFTTFPEYAAFTYCIDPNEAVLIVTFLSPGNAYPVTEQPTGSDSLKGTKLKVYTASSALIVYICRFWLPSSRQTSNPTMSWFPME